MQIWKLGIDGQLVNLAAIVFGFGMCYQKLRQINGDVRDLKKWRDDSIKGAEVVKEDVVKLWTRCRIFHNGQREEGGIE